MNSQILHAQIVSWAWVFMSFAGIAIKDELLLSPQCSVPIPFPDFPPFPPFGSSFPTFSDRIFTPKKISLHA